MQVVRSKLKLKSLLVELLECKFLSCYDHLIYNLYIRQPVLTPVKLGQGGVFEYCSGFTISTASGFISGSLLFKDLESKEEFVVPIKKTPFCAQKAYID